MFLSKVEMDLSSLRVRSALQDCQKMHRMITGFFGTSREAGNILYRCRLKGTSVQLYIYSSVPMDRTCIIPGVHIVGEKDVTNWLDNMCNGDTFDFQVLAFPAKKIAIEGAKNSRRRVLRDPDERMNWLIRKGKQGGFQIIHATESAGRRIYGVHSSERGGRMFIDSYCYSGRLLIIDADAFRGVVSQGIGSGRAYGLGMLLLKNGTRHA